MAISSKNKNRLRWVLGIVAGILVTIGGFFAVQFIMKAIEEADPYFLAGSSPIGKGKYVKYIAGKVFYYTTLSGQYKGDMNVRAAVFLTKYGMKLLFVVLGLCMFLLVGFLRKKKVWKEAENFRRKGYAYVAELLVAALCCLPVVMHNFENYFARFKLWQVGAEAVEISIPKYVAESVYPLLAAEVYLFFCFWFLRPLFALGVKQYLKEYSLLCLGGRGIAKLWIRYEQELIKAGFDAKTEKILKKVMWVQFGIMFLCVVLWFVGIPLLILYLVAMYRFLKEHYKELERDYTRVLTEIDEIAAGNLSGQAGDDFGLFEPMRTGLTDVREGLRKAVEEEVKSERMKTELITNVSHDLKTPLTAILTYVELLKQEGITEEERDAYIATLEKKSNRLKVLIEDLFEVSRAASNTVELMQTEVDMVKMVKQAAVEHEELLTVANLSLRQTMPEEDCMVCVDGQKTYRIFENLFSNVCKYAMPGSRVYVRVYEKMGWYYAELKNISAMELSVDAEELTERFVRGDASRNTEGSGLGLAIAKSLTEVQGGSFRVEIDGDLFKVEVGFPKLTYIEEQE